MQNPTNDSETVSSETFNEIVEGIEKANELMGPSERDLESDDTISCDGSDEEDNRPPILAADVEEMMKKVMRDILISSSAPEGMEKDFRRMAFTSVDEEPKKSIWIYPAYANEPYCNIEISKDSSVEWMRQSIEKDLGIKDPASRISFYFYDANKKQHIIPLNSLSIFAFETIKEDEVSIRIQARDAQAFSAQKGDPWHDDVYFDSYAWMHIHWEMLSDYKRCSAYYDAIQRFKEDIAGKVILDVGCGTGILSVYCARAGAKKVYAIEASSIFMQAESFIKENGVEDIVELIHGKVEEVVLPIKEVDVIVSEWMGYFLLCESMLETVIFARDKWLKKDGLMFPQEANLYLAPVHYDDYYKKRVSFFDTLVDGVEIKSLKHAAIEEFTTKTLRCYDLPPSDILCQPITLKTIDCNTVSVHDCRKTYKPFSFKIGTDQWILFEWKYSPQKTAKPTGKPVVLACSADGWIHHEMSYQDDVWRVALNFQPGTYQYKFIVNGEWVIDVAKPNETDNLGNINVINNILTVTPRTEHVFNGFGAWFNVVFRGSDKNKEPIILTTDPRIGYQTHWKQDVCLYRKNLPIPQDRDINGIVKIEQMGDYKRHFAITISPSERAILRDEKCFPEQEWTF